MNESLKQAVETLVSEHYLVFIDAKLVVTNKFERELAEINPGDLFQKPEPLPDIPRVMREVLKVDPKSKVAIAKAGEPDVLIEFIKACEVPQKIRGGDGKSYWANKYSKEAARELTTILNSGYKLDILTAATRLYYKSGGMLEAITNYIVRGTWRTHYLEMEAALAGGTIKQLIQSTLSDNTQRKDMYDDR